LLRFFRGVYSRIKKPGAQRIIRLLYLTLVMSRCRVLKRLLIILASID